MTHYRTFSWTDPNVWQDDINDGDAVTVRGNDAAALDMLVADLITSQLGERWYSDGLAAWPEQTARDALQLRLMLIERCRKPKNVSFESEALAKKLAACRPEYRCGSGACPECQRAVQNLLVNAMSRYFSVRGKKLDVVSLVPPEQIMRPGNDALKAWLTAGNRMRRALMAAKVGPAVGALDISANEHVAGHFQPHYKPHLWVFLRAGMLNRGTAARERLREFLPRGNGVFNPVKRMPWNGGLNAMAYVCKNVPTRRISGMSSGNALRAPHKKTRIRSPLSHQHVEIALILDEVGFGRRLFLRYIEVTSSDGRLTFRPRSVAGSTDGGGGSLIGNPGE